jgi:hypothetical protein
MAQHDHKGIEHRLDAPARQDATSEATLGRVSCMRLYGSRIAM